MSTLTFEADRDTVTTNGIRAIKVDVDSYDSGVLQSYTVYPKTLRDIYLMGIGDKIRDKKEWWIKFENEEIWNKWMKELRDAAGQPDDWEDEESQSAEDEVVEEDKKDPVSEVKKVIGVSEDTGEIMTTEVEPKDTGDDGEGAGDEAAEHEEADDEAADDEEAEDEEASDGEGRTWPENKFITRRMEAYLKEELRHCAKYRKAELGIDDALDRIYKSDILIPAELKSELITNVAPLSNIPDSQKDWHPGSNQRVHDLVHPSLYPLIYGKSRLCATRPLGSPCLPHSRSGKIIDFDAKASRVYGFNRHVTSDFVSTQFQWLPSEFTIDPSTKEAKITSYINNLHPVHHKKLYYTIEKVLTKCIPMFDMVLLGLRYEHGGVTRVIDSPYDHWPEQPSYEGELTDEEEEALWDDWQNTRQVIIPDAEDFEAHHPQRVIPPWVPKELHPVAPPKPIKPPSPEVESPPKLDPAEDVEMSGTQVDESEEKADGDSFTVEEEGNDDADEGEGSDDDPDEEEENDDDAGEEGDNDDDGGQGQKPVVLSSKNTLSDFGKGQIIVKLANIELTPEKPTYEGGVWHLEGTVGERIISTVIYYYSSENITENELHFRQACEEPSYEQSDYDGVKAVFGLENEGQLNQPWGSVITKEDRVLGFTNIHQHRVSPFSLIDPTKPGCRKILVFFLIDPTIEIISTADIAPQQHSWWKEEVRRINPFSSLPAEISEMTLNTKTDWNLDLEEAKEIRGKLMEERGKFVEKNSEQFEREFSLCEH